MKITTISVLMGWLFLFFLIPFSSSAQNYKAYNLDQILNTAGKAGTLFDVAQTEKVRSLIYDLNPTIFVKDQSIKSYQEENPLVLRVTPDSWNVLTGTNPIFNSVELLTLELPQVNNISGLLDLSELSSFNSLSYIFVECTGTCTASQVEQIFRSTKNITVFYLVTTPQ
ncbi:hypothetical protein [Autumnicola musiva]|uniref:Uncharacterized protein n=1 Tax=Autumnicola musiva TaxID=3075589 RepID=A0ABU3D9K2_9FLAO|nr:hypothetical protein [Zunongwangia sp. F117]MDT0678222.1 hypothetical protein [Zunongwangia sp. F117]